MLTMNYVHFPDLESSSGIRNNSKHIIQFWSPWISWWPSTLHSSIVPGRHQTSGFCHNTSTHSLNSTRNPAPHKPPPASKSTQSRSKVPSHDGSDRKLPLTFIFIKQRLCGTYKEGTFPLHGTPISETSMAGCWGINMIVSQIMILEHCCYCPTVCGQC